MVWQVGGFQSALFSPHLSFFGSSWNSLQNGCQPKLPLLFPCTHTHHPWHNIIHWAYGFALTGPNIFQIQCEYPLCLVKSGIGRVFISTFSFLSMLFICFPIPILSIPFILHILGEHCCLTSQIFQQARPSLITQQNQVSSFFGGFEIQVQVFPSVELQLGQDFLLLKSKGI